MRERYSDVEGTDLNYENNVQLMVATILSAQSTDETVNKITDNLFSELTTVEDFAEVNRDELEELIYSSGYYRNKAKWIKGACEKIVEEYNSKVPKNMEDLMELPGVGRKTANIIMSEAFGKNKGIPVDTHVQRLSNRLGLTQEENRKKIEEKLTKLYERNQWYEISTLLINHGRTTCEARNPKCRNCTLSDYCPSFPIE